MVEMTAKKVSEELQDVALSLVTKTQVSGLSRREALERVAEGCQLLIKELSGRASGQIEDAEF